MVMTLRIVSDQDSAIRGTLASALVALARPKLTPGDLSRRVPTRWCDNHARENATSTAKSHRITGIDDMTRSDPNLDLVRDKLRGHGVVAGAVGRSA
jgi:hypothetical protein